MKQSNFRLIRLALFSTCSVPFLAVAAPALAQSAPQASSDQQLGEIVVTAQRRSELSRDVPISITAISGDTLTKSGIADTGALVRITPGLRMEKTGNFMLPAIRGISTTISGPGNDPNVAIYVDGVYQPESTANTFDLPDLERVEVLKGPQGTLFGRNATGGAIQVITKTPGNTTEGTASISYGSYHDFSAKAYIATPLVEDKVALGVAASIQRADTYYNNIGGGVRHPVGIDSKLVRGKLRITPSDGLRITLTGLYSDRLDSSALIGTPLNGNSVARVLDPAAIIPTKPWDFASEVNPFQRSETTAFSGRVELDVGPGTLTSLTAYSAYFNTSILDADYAKSNKPLNYYADSSNRSFSEELTYATHSDGPFNMSAGVFFIDGWGGWTPLGLRTFSLTANIVSRGNYRSWAAFGELYYDVTPELQVIVGGRYSHEHRDLNTKFDTTLSLAPSLNQVGNKNWDSFTPRVAIKYKLTPSANIYASYSQGFKSGVFNTTSLVTSPAADPEKLHAWELGFKGRVADWLNLDAAGFYYDYKSPQLFFLIPATGLGGLPTTIYGNAGGAKIYGLDFDAQFRFGRHFDARANVSWLHSKYGAFNNVNTPTPNVGTNGLPNLTGNTDTSINATGTQMIRAPRLSAYLTATYHADVAGGILDLTGSVYHAATTYLSYDHRIVQPSYQTYDARIAWSPASNKFTISAFGRNLSNEAVISGTYIQSAGDGISYAPPRTFGVQLDVRF